MSKPFPQHEYLSGNFAPIGMECDSDNVPIVGEFPRELCGFFYRNGANPQFSPADDKYHWFLGDGMIHSFRIEAGRVAYKNRWIRTPKWQLENGAGRALFGSWGDPRSTDPATVGTVRGTANTNIIWHGGRFMAIEEINPPFELDPVTLESKGFETFGGAIPRITAHPKLDRDTGELVYFAYSADGRFTPGIDYGVIDKHGRVVRKEFFKAPYGSMIHEHMLTKNHVLFPIMPLRGDMSRAGEAECVYAWEPDKKMHVGVLRRDGAVADIRWFQSDPCFVIHPMNAWEEDGKIIAYVMQYDAAPPNFPNADGTPPDPVKTMARLSRWTLDLEGESNELLRERVDNLGGEFPRIDERYAGRRNRHGYYACYLEKKGSWVFDSLAHIDLESGRRELYTFPSGDFTSEPVFIPRSASAPEGDGWLLAVAYRGKECRSDLVLFDALRLPAGPVAEARLSHRVPFGFHGYWLSDHERLKTPG